MDQQDYKKNYLDYFRKLENEIMKLKNYVHFSEKNFKTFSYEITKLLQLICSEIDVVAKVIVKKINNIDKELDNIKKWGFELQKLYDKDLYIALSFNDDFIIIPFNEKWKYEKRQNEKRRNGIYLISDGKNPKWWIAYNRVKHARTSLVEDNESNFERANFECVVNAFGALYILENILYKNIYPKEGNLTSELFKCCKD